MKTLTLPLTPLSELRDCAPELARRLGGILLALAGLVARQFLKNPRLVLLIVPLWRRLTRISRRFEQAVLRPGKMRAARPGRGSAGKALAAALPNRRGWLVGELGAEAAGYGSQLAHVLAGPEMQALLAAVPAAGQVLRPVCRMLGFDLAQVTRMVAPDVLVARVVSVPPRTDVGGTWSGVSADCLGFATSG